MGALASGRIRGPSRSRLYVALVAAVGAALVVAPAALGHAMLVATSPAADAVVAHAPARVLLRFDEAVATEPDAVRVLDSDGRPLATGPVVQRAPDELALTLPRTLARGSYVVAWRVVSIDTHPVHGAFVFSVGAPGRSALGTVLRQQATPPTLSAGFDVVRFAAFALLLLVAGGAALLMLGRDDLPPPLERRLHRILGAAAGTLVLVSVVALGFEGATAEGLGVGGVLHPHVYLTVARERFGEVWLARAALAAIVAFVARRPGRRRRMVALAAAAPLVATPAFSGHADANGILALVADVAHVAAAAAWTGGLAFLVLALVSAGPNRWPLAARLVPRFSIMAVGSVAVLLVAGTAGGYVEVRTWSALWTTTYGRLLLAKIALVLPLLALGAYNNKFAVPRLRAQVASVVEQRRFLRAAGTECTLFVAIVAVTAVLVAEPPARGMAAMDMTTGTLITYGRVGPLDTRIAISPGAAGRNRIELDFSGKPAIADAKVSASLADSGIGPLRFQARRAGPHRFVVDRADLPLSGTWSLFLEVRHGNFDEWARTVSVHLAPMTAPPRVRAVADAAAMKEEKP